MASDIVERLKWWADKRVAPKSMPTLVTDCRAAIDYIEAQDRRIAETRAAALEEIDTGEVERLRAALEFYADELTWADTNPKDDGRLTVLVPSPSFAEIDRGERARSALSPNQDDTL